MDKVTLTSPSTCQNTQLNQAGGPTNLLFAALHELDEVREKHVPVPLTEAVDVVRHLKGQRTRELSRALVFPELSVPFRRSGV